MAGSAERDSIVFFSRMWRSHGVWRGKQQDTEWLRNKDVLWLGPLDPCSFCCDQMWTSVLLTVI